MIGLEDSLLTLSGVGKKSASKLAELGLVTIEDLLLYYPFRYDDLQYKFVLDLEDGEKSLFRGKVVTSGQISYFGRKKNRLRFSMKQGDVVFTVSFFNQPFLLEKIQLGQELLVWGRWDKKKSAVTGMKLFGEVISDLNPVYHVIQGVKQASLVKLIKQAVDKGYHRLLQENLPQVLLKKYRLMNRQEAVLAMHFPKNLQEYKQSLRRMKFEEFFYFQMQLQLLKSKNNLRGSGLSIAYDIDAVARQIEKLPFDLTGGQQQAVKEILGDMDSSRHMNRLLQGDVGSGKTVVAGMAMYAAHTAGYQSALMVPTEILAEQHYESLLALFPKLSIALLTGGMRPSMKREALTAIANGDIDIIVGTHALIQDSVVYHHLGLVITDEQHRFGVNQRRLLREKGENPDVLMMTATPIPRTLAITAFGDMDISVIRQLPEGRKTIITRWVKKEQFKTVLSWLEKELSNLVQVYIVSPLIEESEVVDLQNAIALKEELEEYFHGNRRISLLHGKMKSNEKEDIMQSFKQGNIDILVSTTVIEVGVNVPNATIMIIMEADRFGLSQLHQLRGRVGRGHKQSYAILVANPKTESGKERMKMMVETTDGFVLAESDLKMRGSGEIFGVKQSGLPEFRVGDLIEDFPIVEEARKVAAEIVSNSNWQNHPDWFIVSKYLQRQDILD